MYRMSIWVLSVTAVAWPHLASAADWQLGTATLIDASGTRPSLWAGTIAYLDGLGGAVMYYDGSSSMYVYGPAEQSWEPANGNGSVAWRNLADADDPGTNDIFRWDGSLPVVPENISASPGVVDSDVSAGSNGDLIWTRAHTAMIYYEAWSGDVYPTGLNGVHPSLYIGESGVITAAFQDPAAPYEVIYYDGVDTQAIGLGYTEGPGPSYEAHPCVWDGAVAWIGRGVGNLFVAGEVFFWKDGQTYRLTNDDAVNGIADKSPRVWHDRVIWSRHVNGPFSPPRLCIWDGTEITELTTSGGYYPSFHDGKVAWVDAEGLKLAAVFVPGDCTEDGQVDLDDHAEFVDCLVGPGAGLPNGCDCADLNDSGHVDLADFAELQRLFEAE